MRALLHNLLVELNTKKMQVRDGWQLLFDQEIKAAAVQPESNPDIRLAAVVTAQLPQSPAARPSYIRPGAEEQQRPLRYFETAYGGHLALARPAQITFNFPGSEAQITLTEQLLEAGNLEDLTLIALSPFLRRRRFFLTHAFAATKESAVLLCGPPGSGKTTTGLALLGKGWRYLANDATLLREVDGQILAYPSPGAINIHPQTLALLPYLRQHVHPTCPPKSGRKYLLSRGTLFPGQPGSEPTPVETIFFPRLTDQPEYSLHETNSAVGLARLIEENIDQWDRDTYEAHIDLLTRLSRQAAFYDLHLPRGQAPDIGAITALFGH